MTQFISLSDARKSLKEIVDSKQTTVLTRNGQPTAVVLPAHEYRAFRALVNATRDPKMFTAAMASHRKLKKGELDVSKLPELDTTLTDDGSAPLQRVENG